MSDWRATIRTHLFANALGKEGDYIDRWLHLIFDFKDWRKQGFISDWDVVQEWMQLVPMYETTTASDYEWVEGEVVYV
jgi:hypothetical protein